MTSAPESSLPKIIQGGMGAGVSNWRLARAVAELGQLGVVSGTALDLILARRLQDGDPGRHMRRALDHFPFSGMADRVWKKYHVPGGKPKDAPYAAIPMQSRQSPRELIELTIVANFVEVYLAMEGHDGPVGINYLEKIQAPHLPSLYGAMLAGVTYVLMGAGIPQRIPGILDRFVHHEPAAYSFYVAGADATDDTTIRFDPRQFMERDLPPLRRPRFLPIIASNTLAVMLMKKSNGPIDGFVIEGPTAGGHNAPPRGGVTLSDSGEPVYGERDVVDLAKIRDLGLPFWVAGGCAMPDKLREILSLGGAGIQVGTAFALCEESGLQPEYRAQLLAMAVEGSASIFTDPRASPTGFPFKVARMDGSLSDEDVYQARPRICDMGYLREPYKRPDGAIGYRCASEPVEIYLAKGGREEDAAGRKCLCNALLSNIGHPQVREDGAVEKPLITSGDDLLDIARFLPAGQSTYTARDVIEHLLGPLVV